MATRVTSTRLVGRAGQLAQLTAALSEAAARRPSLAFVAGESGVGKTRLLSELHRVAREEHGARVLTGDCVELGEGELPYAPLVGALRPLVRDGDPVLAELSPGVLGDLRPLLPGAEAPPAHAGDETGAQTRLFEALLTLLNRLGDEQPVVLSLEDLHWADPSTRAFLAYLSSSLCRERVLVVTTYRADELHRRHPLRPLLAELERDPLSHRVDVLPLARAELAEQLEDILGAVPDADLVARLHERSEGNPLFTEELLAAGLDGRGGAPPTLRDALMVRVERLGPDAQELLRLMAAGRRLEHDVLAAASDLPPRALRDALREAVAAHILAVDEDGAYTFRHALLREVLVDDLLPGEAAELHLALARALVARGAPTGSERAILTAAIASHFHAAGDQPAALEASVRAAEAAEAIHASGEAAQQLERALQLWDRVPDAADRIAAGQVDLLIRAGDAHFAEGNAVRQETLLRRALELSEGDDDATIRTLERLAQAKWALNQQDTSIATLDRAMALDTRGAHTATLLAHKAKHLMLMSRYRSAENVARKAIALAQEQGDVRSELYAANSLGVSLAGLGRLEEGAQVLRDARVQALAADLLGRYDSASVNLADSLMLGGRTREALDIALAGSAEMRRRSGRSSWLSLLVAEIATEIGDWDLAAAHLPEGRFHGTTDLNLQLRRAELALGRGDHDAAAAALARAGKAAQESREPQFLGVLGALAGELARRSGDLEAARGAVEEALDRIEFCSDDVHRIARVATVGVKVEADAAERARDLGEPAAEQEALARADGLLSRVAAAAGGDGRVVEQVYLLTASAERARASGAPDAEAWAAAAAGWDAIERPYVAAQARWRQAEAQVARGDREGAAATVRLARTATDRIGAAWLTGEIDGLAARARLRGTAVGETAPRAAAEADQADAVVDPFGLTDRERQVLALVARGATNREIGTELFMAEKTASVHVSRILAKLDVRSRTEAAGVAHRHGLSG